MGTHGVSTFLINSKFASGNLVFYERGVGRTATGDLLTIGTATITVGGDAQDVDLKVYLGSATEYVLYDVGNSRVDYGEDSQGVDIRIFGDTASSLLLWDTSDDRLEFDGCDLNLQDSDILQFGDAQDVAITWNATNLVITPAVDDTGAIYFGNGTLDMDVRVHQGTTTDYVEFDVGAKALEVAGDTRIDLSGATIAAANTDGGLIKAGTSSAKVTESTANMKFMSFYFDNAATSGSSEGLYIRLYDTGAGKTSQALRAFTSVTDVAGSNARGAHISLSFGTTGTITGLGAALDATLHIPNSATQSGTITAISADINSDGATSDPAGAVLSVIRVANQGNATGMADVDTDAFLLNLTGWTEASGSMLDSTANAATGDATIKIRWTDGTTKYLLVANDPN